MDGIAPSELTDDALTDRVRVLQRRGGHRYSFDDVVTAWVAVRSGGAARTYLDLGCGLGSVLLMVADRLTHVRALGIEAQSESFALARENVARSWLADRVIVRHGDLRDRELCDRARDQFVARGCGAFAAGESDSWRGFDLITGTPPYKKPGTATPSPDPQRAHARIELRGGIEEYLATAARMLAPAGTVVVCMETGAVVRVEAAARAAGLAITERVDVVPIASGKGRLFSVFTLQHARVAQLAAAEALPSLAGGVSPNGAPHTRAERNTQERAAGAQLTAAEALPCLAGGVPNDASHIRAERNGQERAVVAQSSAAEASAALSGGVSPNGAPQTWGEPHREERAAGVQPSAAEALPSLAGGVSPNGAPHTRAERNSQGRAAGAQLTAAEALPRLAGGVPNDASHIRAERNSQERAVVAQSSAAEASAALSDGGSANGAPQTWGEPHREERAAGVQPSAAGALPSLAGGVSPNGAPHTRAERNSQGRAVVVQPSAAEASAAPAGGVSPNGAPHTRGEPNREECAALVQPSAAEPAALPLATPSAGAPNARGCSSDMQIGDPVALRSAERLRAILDPPVALRSTDARSAASHCGSAGISSAAVSTLLLRDASGARTPAALELRRFFGLGDPVDELPSPPRMSAGSRSMA